MQGGEYMKSWWESKTVWFNIFMTVIDFAAFLETQTGLPEWVAPLAVTIHGIGNVILRVWFTSTEVEKKLM